MDVCLCIILFFRVFLFYFTSGMLSVLLFGPRRLCAVSDFQLEPCIQTGSKFITRIEVRVLRIQLLSKMSLV